MQAAVEDAPDGQAPQVIAVIQVRDQQLERTVEIARGRRDMIHDRVEQRTQIGGSILHRSLRDPIFGNRVEYRKIELVFMRVQIDEQVVNLVQYFRHARVRTIDLV